MKNKAFCVLLLALFFLPATAQSRVPERFFGIMSQEGAGPADVREMASGGISAYRLPMSWDAVQADDNSAFNWSAMDYTMRQTASAGIQVLPIMMGTPPGFAQSFKTLPIFTEKQRQGWATYLREAIARYGRNGDFWQENPDLPYLPIRTWQIWNEVNFIWFAEPVSPLNYFLLLEASKKVIRSADPEADIMLSSFFADPGAKSQGIRAEIFLKKLYLLGAKPYFDSVALHPYSKNTAAMRSALLRFRKTLQRHGEKNLPLHITEMGWGSGKATAFDKGSLAGQARELTRAYRFLLKARKSLRLASVYWFSWEDLPADGPGCNFCYHSGLFFSGEPLEAKPAWYAFRRIVRAAS